MDFSEEWKSLWPISSVFSPPLLSTTETGPLIFNPSPTTLTQLFSSPSLSPLLPPPFPNLSLTRFLQTSTADSFLLPSTRTSIATQFGLQVPDPSPLLCNRIQLLRCPGTASVVVFFPTGDNSDQVGFVILSVKDTQLDVRALGDSGDVFVAETKLNQRILRLLVNPVADFDFLCSSLGKSCFITIGYLLACTMYSVFWFRVRIKKTDSDLERVVVDFLGSKLFKTCAVVHACWSPHLPEECVVLLESGELFLFDLDSCCKTRGLIKRFLGKKLRILWSDFIDLEKGQWLSCEFSWHPRIVIVAHSSNVFLVDSRSEGCSVTCLLKIDRLVMGNPMRSDQFIALARAGSDGFYFTVASNYLLILCDVRKPLMPVLQWAHGLDNPTFITVFRLSDLRSHPKDDRYKWASDSGNCIILGSFLNCEFSAFCYGPGNKGCVAFEILKFSKSFCAWGLPSELSLSGRGCNCGSCLVSEEFSKDALPEWIDWRQKKEIVLGFGIFDKGLSVQLYEPDSFGGFSVIRMMSSGKLEMQTYSAAWEFWNNSEAHKGLRKSINHFEDSLLYAIGNEEYNFPKKFQYLKLDYLEGSLKDNLAKVLVKKIRKLSERPGRKDSSESDFHQHICQKLKAYGFTKSRSSPAIYDVLKYISSPTSIHDIALKSIWGGLPMSILCLAFSTCSDLLEVLMNHKKVSPEFLDIPDQGQMPPFPLRKPSCRSSKWSHKTQPSDALVGPIVPIRVLIILRKLYEAEETDGLSANTELELHCNKVMQVANEVAASTSGSGLYNEHAVSLADDTEETCYVSQNEKLYSLHEPVAFSGKLSTVDPNPGSSGCESERFTTLIFKKHQELVSNSKMKMGGLELFDKWCPSELKFNDRAMNFGPKELKTYKLLMRQDRKFQEGFELYQKYSSRSNFPKQEL
ncbi:unnamed protein product [Ilex paraguariensis]|uniref:Uncharacterized protein n=1 Tax=Ilex paraguariensis TaxID=185542 RepID=A0ABC8TG03_9AQUA